MMVCQAGAASAPTAPSRKTVASSAAGVLHMRGDEAREDGADRDDADLRRR